ncbi:hypothetical protein, partial [Halomonas sp. AOP23-I1-8]|uniref:hypothetical protein n=1 Tax=Halomonas sp. AOP23-I1-8 TaxID=3457712 RepID=UPI0040341510
PSGAWLAVEASGSALADSDAQSVTVCGKHTAFRLEMQRLRAFGSMICRQTKIDAQLLKGYKRRNPAEAGCRTKKCYQHFLVGG